MCERKDKGKEKKRKLCSHTTIHSETYNQIKERRSNKHILLRLKCLNKWWT